MNFLRKFFKGQKKKEIEEYDDNNYLAPKVHYGDIPGTLDLGWYFSERKDEFQMAKIREEDRATHLYVVGATGAGKTILLETIAGIYNINTGKIIVDGKDITQYPPEKRNIGIVYQDFYQLKKILPDSKFIDVSHAFTESRIIKDECEIENIRKSCKIADAVMEKIPDILHEGIHEYEVAAEIDYIMQRNGAEKPAFETISSFASNTAEPHYTHGDGKLKKGDFALFDFGASFKRYNSDITRTFTFGKAEKRQREMHKTVFEAQKVGFDLIAPGIIAKEVHNAVNSYIDNTKFKGRFIHSTGHSLGLAVHDGPGFTPDSNIELKENMVLTVEPGIYLPDFGGVRIEDDILIKKKGLELLTKSSRELIEI